MRAFADTFELTDQTTIIDIGGTPTLWRVLADATGIRPRVTLVNLDLSPRYALLPHTTYQSASALALPYPDGAFDVAFCNSVIEHVGTLADQAVCASEVRRVGRRYWVQTPNRYFPVEPHLWSVNAFWAGEPARRRIARMTSLYRGVVRPPLAKVNAILDEVRLLTRAEMCDLFPDAAILPERLGPLTKSWLAVRH